MATGVFPASGAFRTWMRSVRLTDAGTKMSGAPGRTVAARPTGRAATSGRDAGEEPLPTTIVNKRTVLPARSVRTATPSPCAVTAISAVSDPAVTVALTAVATAGLLLSTVTGTA